MIATSSRVRHWIDMTLGRVRPDGHGQRRYVRIIQGAVAGLAGQGVTSLVALISIPLTVEYLGAERYGVWVVISTILAWLSVADVGLGNGLVNALAECYGKNRPEVARSYVTTAFALLAAVSLAIALLCVAGSCWINWIRLVNMHSPEARVETPRSVAFALVIFLLSFPLTLVPKILDAYQESAARSYWAAGGSVVSLLALLTVTHFHGGLVWLVAALYGSIQVVWLVCALWLFTWHKPWLAPRANEFDRAQARSLVGTGWRFLIIQVGALINLNLDVLIISYYLGPSHVTPYAVTARLFAFTALVQALAFPTVWAAYAEAVIRRDGAWIRRAFKLNMVLSVSLTALLILPLLLFGQELVRWWAGASAEPSLGLIYWMGAWCIIQVSMSVVASLLNGSGHIKGQLVYGSSTAILNIILSILLVQSFGVPGVMAATVIAYIICNVIPALVETGFILREMRTWTVSN